jgi:two-component system response regulator ResD
MLRRTVLSERATTQQKQLSFPGLDLDLPTRTVTVKGDEQHLTPKEFDLLFFLASQPRRVFSREEIVENVWGYTPVGDDLRTVDTHVKRLRQKLEEKYDVPWSIATVWGVGYKFEAEE